MATKAFLEGRLAALDGELPTFNPYRFGTRDYCEWEEGFRTAPTDPLPPPPSAPSALSLIQDFNATDSSNVRNLFEGDAVPVYLRDEFWKRAA